MGIPIRLRALEKGWGQNTTLVLGANENATLDLTFFKKKLVNLLTNQL
jgi:hypothetical protein